MEALRRFLVEHYRIDFIISTDQRSAFSESARFREVLLVATKKIDRKDAKCLFSNLKRIPVDDSDASFLAGELKSYKSTTEEVNDADLSTKVVSQKELHESIDNWFKFISKTSEESVIETIERDAPENLTSFKEMLERKRGYIIRGIEHGTGKPISVASAFILSSERHAKKQQDKWIVKESNEDSVTVKDRIVGTEVTVPRKCVIPALRRPSGLQSIDISDEVDYAIVSRFANDQHFFIKNLADKKISVSSYVKEWRKYLELRKSNFVISRRFDISAVNTIGLAFYSREKISPEKMSWSIVGIEDYEGKILALWFNSTINLEQILSYRAETRGAFMGIDRYILKDFLIPNIDEMSVENRSALIALFDKVAKIVLPSVLEQLTTKNSTRRMIDEAFLDLFKVKINLDEYYDAISKNILSLANIMKEGSS